MAVLGPALMAEEDSISKGKKKSHWGNGKFLSRNEQCPTHDPSEACETGNTEAEVAAIFSSAVVSFPGSRCQLPRRGLGLLTLW